MDVTLTRILSLLPHENGKIKRGSQKTFAQSIGYGSGDIVSMWINGTSQSYKKKLHQIADEYHVSVAWLKGETADPTVEAERAKEKAPKKTRGALARQRGKGLFCAAPQATSGKLCRSTGVFLPPKRCDASRSE